MTDQHPLNPDYTAALADAAARKVRGDAPVMTDADRIESLALELRQLAFRMQCRVDACEERNGSKEAAVTSSGVGISYLLARDLARTLALAADFVDAA